MQERARWRKRRGGVANVNYDGGRGIKQILRTYRFLSLTSSLLAVSAMTVGLCTVHWQRVFIDQDYLNFSTTWTITEGDCFLTFNNSKEKIIYHVASPIDAGLWETCDRLDDNVRISLSKSGQVASKCRSYHHIEDSLLEMSNELDIVMGVTRSASACAIVATVTLIIGLLLGTFAAIKQQIIFATISGVCFFAAAIYVLFTLILVQLRSSRLKTAEGPLIRPMPEFVNDSLRVAGSVNVGLACVALVSSCLAGAAWILFSLHLKRTRSNYMYSTNYDQICSM